MAYYGNEPAKVAVKVGSGVITATELADDSITTADIIADAITPTELDEDGTGFQVGTLGIGAAVSGGHTLLVSGTSSLSGNVFTSGYFQSNASGIGFRLANQSYDSLYYSATNRIGFSGSTTQRFQCTAATFTGTIGSGAITSTAGISGTTGTFSGEVAFGGGSPSDNSIYKGSNNYLYVQGGTLGLALKGKNSDDAAIYLANSGQTCSVYTNDAERLSIGNSGATFTGDVTIDGASTDYDQLTIEGAAASGIRFKDSGGTTDGFVYASGSEIGFLKSDGNWIIKAKSAGADITGDLIVSSDIYGNNRLYLGTKMALDIDGTALYLGSTLGAVKNETTYIRSNDANAISIDANQNVVIEDGSLTSKKSFYVTNDAPQIFLTDTDFDRYGSIYYGTRAFIFDNVMDNEALDSVDPWFEWRFATAESGTYTSMMKIERNAYTFNGAYSASFTNTGSNANMHVTAGNGSGRLYLDGTEWGELWFETSDSIKAGIKNNSSGDLILMSGGSTTALTLDSSQIAIFAGDVDPSVDGAHDLGSPTKRWANVYTGDLHLKNDKGDWTIVEGEEELYLINNLTNKKYSIMMKEVS